MTHQAPADVVVSSNEDPLSVLLHQVGVVCGYHITRPATEDHEFVNVCNGDLRTLHEAYDALAPLNATTPASQPDFSDLRALVPRAVLEALAPECELGCHPVCWTAPDHKDAPCCTVKRAFALLDALEAEK